MATKDPGNTPYTRTLQLAAKTLGSAERLAAVLAVEHAELLRWISGAAFPPHEVFLKALDIVANGRADKQTLAERSQAKANRSQAKADRSQAKADRHQASADRHQASADRDQASADREQERARQSRGDAGKTARPGQEHFRHVQPDHSGPASNDPDEESGKSTGSDQARS